MKKENQLLKNTDIANLAPPSRIAHWILACTALFLLIAFIWAKLAILDEVTRAEGKVIPSSKVQIVQNLEGGIVRDILVREGQIVEKDQILISIDDTQFDAEYKRGLTRTQLLDVEMKRLSAELDNKPFKPDPKLEKLYPEMIQNERALYNSRINEMNTKLTTLQQQAEQKKQELEEQKAKQGQIERSYGLVKKELSMTRPLLKQGAVSEVEILRLERQTNDLKGELDGIKMSLPRLESAYDEALNKIQEFKVSIKTKILDELTETKNELAPLLQTNTALQDKVDRTAVRSPVRGTIKQINVATIGGVIKPGMDLIEIVPMGDTLLVEANVRPGDIGFIRPGQSASVSITAYDQTIYGKLEAVVEHISADTIKDEKDQSFYKIYVRTNKNLLDNQGKELIIIPGMLASVGILTGKKSVLNYLLKPIIKTKQNALTER